MSGMLQTMMLARQRAQESKQKDPFTQGLLSTVPQMQTPPPPPMAYFPGFGPNGLAGAPPQQPMTSSGGGGK